MTDFYYYPEKLGLLSFGEISHDDEPYQFDITAVWIDAKTGEFAWARDWGCSCPSPFENTTDADLTRGNFHELAKALECEPDDYEAAQVVELLARARAVATS